MTAGAAASDLDRLAERPATVSEVGGGRGVARSGSPPLRRASDDRGSIPHAAPKGETPGDRTWRLRWPGGEMHFFAASSARAAILATRAAAILLPHPEPAPYGLWFGGVIGIVQWCRLNKGTTGERGGGRFRPHSPLREFCL